ncbi:MAG: protein-L-isoaspartate(D-aspartate) O-methyltransferase [Anaerolineales bacterium]|nr:protein-L-isoaspartate(D-aspartate) O-methyltransferase [Anaerolineales bacterium]
MDALAINSQGRARKQPPKLILAAVLILSGCRPPATAVSQQAAEQDPYTHQRLELVEKQIASRGISDEHVLEAMRTVPRHRFVPEDMIGQAYTDSALPIGFGQTISQPYVVAWMTELLDLKPGQKVLEIGTGSGYQAAVLAELGYVEVYSIEIVPELADRAALVLDELGYTGIHTRQGDGYYGWPEQAPFDAIIVTAAPDHLPPPLVEQLADQGRIVIPIGPPGWYQTLWKFVIEDGELQAYNIGDVGFVPFTGEGIKSDPNAK